MVMMPCQFENHHCTTEKPARQLLAYLLHGADRQSNNVAYSTFPRAGIGWRLYKLLLASQEILRVLRRDGRIRVCVYSTAARFGHGFRRWTTLIYDNH